MSPDIMESRLKKVVALKFVWNGGFNSFMNDDLEIKMKEIEKLSDSDFEGIVKLFECELEGRARPDNLHYQSLLQQRREEVREIREKDGNRGYLCIGEYTKALRGATEKFLAACEANGFQNRREYLIFRDAYPKYIES